MHPTRSSSQDSHLIFLRRRQRYRRQRTKRYQPNGQRRPASMLQEHVGKLHDFWSLCVISVSCHSQKTDDTDATMPDPEEGRACGWPGGERRQRRCSEMVRTHQMVDSASCCPIRGAELPFRQRVLPAFSPAARGSSLGSRCKLERISQRWCGLRTCNPFRITDVLSVGNSSPGIFFYQEDETLLLCPCSSMWPQPRLQDRMFLAGRRLCEWTSIVKTTLTETAPSKTLV